MQVDPSSLSAAGSPVVYNTAVEATVDTNRGEDIVVE
jgi:hypothetical protein